MGHKRILGCVFAALMIASPAMAGGKGGGKPPKNDPPAGLPSANVDLVYGVSLDGSARDLAIGIADSTIADSHSLLIAADGVTFEGPSWLPDGRGIVFFSNIAGAGLYFMEIDRTSLQAGAPQRFLATNVTSGQIMRPVVHPMSNGDGSGTYRVAYIDSPRNQDGSVSSADHLFITSFTLSGAAGSLTLDENDTLIPLDLWPQINAIDEAVRDLSFPTWDPSGDRLALNAQVLLPLEADTTSEVLVVDLAAGSSSTSVNGVTRVLANTALEDAFVGETHWSNDGTTLALDYLGDVYFIDIANGDVTNVTGNSDYAQRHPNFSPDDAEIFYAQDGNSPDFCGDPLPKKGKNSGVRPPGIAKLTVDLTSSGPVCDQVIIHAPDSQQTIGVFTLDLWE